MKHPLLGSAGRVTATVAVLDGGLSRSYTAGDRQPYECRDMNIQNGRLVTRDGFYTELNRIHRTAIGDDVTFFTDSIGNLLALDRTADNGTITLTVTVFTDRADTAGTQFTISIGVGVTGFLVLPGASRPDCTALLFVSDGRVFGIHSNEGRCEVIEEPYVPLVSLNGVPLKEGRREGDVGEPLNVLTPKFRCTYTADGEGVHYTLPSVKADTALTVTLTTASGATRYRVEPWEDSVTLTDGDGVSFSRRSGTFCFTQNGEPYAVPDLGLHNHIEAVAESDCAPAVPIAAMKFGIWYGGDTRTDMSGARLFLGGESCVLWSVPDDALYIPHTAYAHVGEPSDPLTGFVKLGEYLVLMKRRSLYAMGYQRDARLNLSADVTATAVFPIFPLHGSIGCDLPETAVEFDHRLLFANTDGAVRALTLTATARRLTLISEPIRPLLGYPFTAGATVHDGRYLLVWYKTVYLYDGEGRWTSWSMDRLGVEPLGVCQSGGKFYFPCAAKAGRGRILVWYGMSGRFDRITHVSGGNVLTAYLYLEDLPVEGRVCTRLYDFGTPEREKRVVSVFAEAEGVDRAAYVTERGETDVNVSRQHGGVKLSALPVRCRKAAVRLSGRDLTLGSVTFHVR